MVKAQKIYPKENGDIDLNGYYVCKKFEDYGGGFEIVGICGYLASHYEYVLINYSELLKGAINEYEIL